MPEGYVPVPYDEFVEMLTAKIKLNEIKDMIQNTDEYCSHGIMVTLGVKEKEVCTDMCATSADATATQANS